MKEKTITVKILRELKQKSRKYVGPLKKHRNFVHIVNHAVNQYLNLLEKEEGNKSE